MPLLLLELKSGASTNATLVREVADAAGNLGISHSVAIWVVHPTVLKVVTKVLAQVQEAKGQPLRLIKAVRNQPARPANATSGGTPAAAAPPALTAADLTPYDMVGPSVRFEVGNGTEGSPYAAAHAAGKPLALWTVDSEQDLEKAVTVREQKGVPEVRTSREEQLGACARGPGSPGEMLVLACSRRWRPSLSSATGRCSSRACCRSGARRAGAGKQ